MSILEKKAFFLSNELMHNGVLNKKIDFFFNFIRNQLQQLITDKWLLFRNLSNIMYDIFNS